ncbi:N-6 DNA methylase [Blautia sp. HCP3S3_G3]|uniref:N-6 DNA methylase n=1 Tax=Blautia sp. HCP3S3_G3 TaxID=3438913 RepID=UPI003F895B00
MDIKSIQIEIQERLWAERIIDIDANKAMFGIATIGLIIGKDRLLELSQDRYSMEERRHFDNDVILSSVKWEGASSLKRDALNLISKQISSKLLTTVINILMNFNLLDIVLHMDFMSTVKSIQEDCLLSSVPWINNLVFEIMKSHGGKSVFNCDCGYGDFIVKMTDKEDINLIDGYSFDELASQVAKIRGFFARTKCDVTFISTLYQPTDKKYDMIYNSLPCGKKYDLSYVMELFLKDLGFSYRINKKKYSFDLLWTINALQSVNENGIVVAVVSNGALYNEVNNDIRKYLVENNYIKAIISLPPSIIPFMGVAASLIILEKCKNKKIKMIDAKEICEKQRRITSFSDDNINYIMKLYLEPIESNVSFEVSYEQIVSNDYNLGINKYIETDPMINPTPLGEVAKSIFRGYQIKATEFDSIATIYEDDTEYRMINVSDVLAEGFVKSKLQPVIIEDERKYGKYLVENRDIIITAKNTTIKTAIYKQQNYKTILTGNLIVIRVDDSKINPYYLKAFLDSRLGESMINSIATGTTVKSINPNNLKKMYISLPSMEIQNKIALMSKDNLGRIKMLLDNYNNAMKRQRKIYDIVTGY